MVGGVASAQEPSGHPPQDQPIHEKFYQGWMMPDNPKKSCCSMHDCYPVEAKLEGDHWIAKRREDAKWISIPDWKIERNRDNPDGRSHMCAPGPYLAEASGVEVFCFSLGGGM